MTAKEKARLLVAQYKSILMDENTNCGEEILCTTIAKKIALVTIDEVQDSIDWLIDLFQTDEDTGLYNPQ